MGGHGLINWADDDKECYQLTLDLIRKAQDFLDAHAKTASPDFGGVQTEPLAEAERQVGPDRNPAVAARQVSPAEKRMIGTVQATDEVLEFVGSKDAARLAELGTSCPDHFLRTKIKPLYVDWQPSEGTDALKEKLAAGLERYVEDYRQYYEEHKHDDSPALRPSSPSVVLIPGVGMVAWGKSKSESRVTAEFYTAAIGVMRGAERVSSYTALPRQEAFDIEYWLLEEAKLQRMPKEKALARQVAVVVGAGSGIGREVVDQLIAQGAVVAAVDLHAETASAAADEVMEPDRDGHRRGRDRALRLGRRRRAGGRHDRPRRRAGDGLGRADDLRRHRPRRRDGGLLPDAGGGRDRRRQPVGDGVRRQRDRAVRCHRRGARSVWEAQGLQGTAVITTSVNAVVPKAGSFAYDTSKAAANHLVRELAVALAPNVRVNGVAPATVVEGSSMFPRDRVKASLTKYGIDHDDDMSTEELRGRLARFYAARTLTDQPITPDDQARAILALVTDDLSKTTGQIISVDGGLRDAFLR